MGAAPGPEVRGPWDNSFVALVTACTDSTRLLAAVTPAAFRNPRREIDGFSVSDKQHLLWPFKLLRGAYNILREWQSGPRSCHMQEDAVFQATPGLPDLLHQLDC